MTINGSTNSNSWTYKLEVSETGYSVQDRTSTVQVKTYIGRASSQSYLGGGYNNSVSVTGASSQSKSGNIPYPTYINGGAWYELQTFTFTVPNTGNPTTITISSSMSSGDFTPSSCSASGTMQLTVLHLDPVIETATMVETNSVLTALNVPDTTVVRYLSKKRITVNATAYDGATLTYKLRHLNTDYTIPASGYQSSNVFNADYTQNDIMLTSNNKAPIIQEIKDSLNGTASDYLFVTINGSTQRPDGIPYTKPSIEKTNTSIKRKSGGGTTLTDNKAVLNLKAKIYKTTGDVIGDNNNIQQIGYKIWEQNGSEPSSYTTLTPTIDSSGNVTITDLEITNKDYTKTYYYKIILKDRFNYQDIVEGTLPTGQSVWTEYKDRVDFLKLTIDGYNPFEYSENEIICGVWFGKPLYRKTFKIESGITSGNTSHLHEISNIDTVFINSGKSFMFNTSNGKTCMLPINQYNNALTYDQVDVYADKTNINIIAQSGWGSDWVAYITLEYTKTTD